LDLKYTAWTAVLCAGRDDLHEAGMQFWYVLMASRNFSGLYCMGIHTSKADCYNPAMTIGSAADSTYEYMLKQWIMSNKTQGVSITALCSTSPGAPCQLVAGSGQAAAVAQ
jgi:mannosyl-oligosaccharide alpha-1,2-mannosidase